jgi:hypothetical protein
MSISRCLSTWTEATERRLTSSRNNLIAGVGTPRRDAESAQELVVRIKKIKNQKIILERGAAEAAITTSPHGWFRAPSQEDKNL